MTITPLESLLASEVVVHHAAEASKLLVGDSIQNIHPGGSPCREDCGKDPDHNSKRKDHDQRCDRDIKDLNPRINQRSLQYRPRGNADRDTQNRAQQCDNDRFPPDDATDLTASGANCSE